MLPRTNSGSEKYEDMNRLRPMKNPITRPNTMAMANPTAILPMLEAKLVNASPDSVIATTRSKTPSGRGRIGSSIQAATAAQAAIATTRAMPETSHLRGPVGAGRVAGGTGSRGAGSASGGVIICVTSQLLRWAETSGRLRRRR
jgi:hypothetical protein